MLDRKKGSVKLRNVGRFVGQKYKGHKDGLEARIRSMIVMCRMRTDDLTRFMKLCALRMLLGVALDENRSIREATLFRTFCSLILHVSNLWIKSMLKNYITIMEKFHRQQQSQQNLFNYKPNSIKHYLYQHFIRATRCFIINLKSAIHF